MWRTVVVPALVMAILAVSCDSGPANTPTPATRADIIATATAYAQSVKTRVAVVPASPTPQPGPRSMVIANTGGLGVFIRRTRDMADKIKAWPDGTIVYVIGDEVEGDGKKWLQAEDPDGNVGWIPVEYLAAPKAPGAP